MMGWSDRSGNGRGEDIVPEATWTVTVDRSPDEVFAYLIDFSKHAEWSPKPYSVEALTDGPVRVGSRFHSKGYIPREPNHENDVEVTKLEPPTRFSFVAKEPRDGPTITTDFVLTPHGNGGTRIDRTMNFPKPAGFPGLIFPAIMAMVIKPGVGKGMGMLKSRLEQGA
jgi:uncharacterized protein YndB with AHSA1/START domain